MNPIISIIIPTFNRARLIADTLQSVLFQKYTNWECIIVDDGSTDDTSTVISKFSDSRIRFFERPANKVKGASSCRNYGLQIAKGELIQFLDDDDLLDADKLFEQVKVYSGGNELLTCKWGSFTELINLESRFKHSYQCYRNFKKGIDLLNTFGLYNEFFPPHVYLTPVGLIKKAGGWNEKLSNNDDAEFFCRVILNASEVKFASEAIVYYRYGNENKLSSIDSFEKISSVIESWRLIEKHIVRKGTQNSLRYVRRAKFTLYTSLRKQSFLSLSEEYKEFFKDRRSYDGRAMVLFKIIKGYF